MRRRCTPTTSRNSCGYGVVGQQSRLDAAPGADVADRGRIVACRDQGVGHGERRQDVAGGAATGDHGVDLVGHRRVDAPRHAQQQPGCGHADEQRTAAGREERQGQAGDRHQADDTADVDDRLDTEPRRDSTGEQHAEPVGSGERGLHAEGEQHHEPADDRDGPDQAEFVGDHGEDEVAVGVGQVAELGVAAADPRPGQAARGHAQVALIGLVGEVVLLLGDVHERREPIQPTRARHDEQQRGAERRRRPFPPAGSTARRRPRRR